MKKCTKCSEDFTPRSRTKLGLEKLQMQCENCEKTELVECSIPFCGVEEPKSEMVLKDRSFDQWLCKGCDDHLNPNNR